MKAFASPRVTTSLTRAEQLVWRLGGSWKASMSSDDDNLHNSRHKIR